MGAAELLDDHRLAVVGRPGQQQVRHPLPGRPGEQRLQPAQRLGGAGVADPPVCPHVAQPLGGGQPRGRRRGRVQVRQVRAAVRHHCSITSNGAASALEPSGSGGSAAGRSGRAGRRRAPFPVAAGPAGRGRGGVGDLAHLLDHREQGGLVDVGAAGLAQPGGGGLLLPRADRRPRQRPVRHLEVGAGVGVECPDAADVAGVAAQDEPAELLAAGDPRLERVAVVLHVADREPGPGQRPPDHRQEVDQERGLAGHRRRRPVLARPSRPRRRPGCGRAHSWTSPW